MPATQRRRLAKQIRKTAKPRAGVVTKRNCLIDHVTASGATTDGAAGVFIKVGSDVVQSAYNDSLTSPVAGQTVAVLFVDGSPYILGRPIGLPNI